MTAPLASIVGMPAAALGRPGIAKPPVTPHEKARAAAQEFEAVFLNSMFSEMFTAIDGEGPFGGGPGAGVWRSFLTDEYAKSFARAGGIGIADDVYRTLLAQQEARSGVQPAIATR
jgi:peptidoglycan hydrolase FlgJ